MKLQYFGTRRIKAAATYLLTRIHIAFLGYDEAQKARIARVLFGLANALADGPSNTGYIFVKQGDYSAEPPPRFTGSSSQIVIDVQAESVPDLPAVQAVYDYATRSLTFAEGAPTVP